MKMPKIKREPKFRTECLMTRSDFVAYCWEFYGPDGIYGEFFDHKLTKAQLAAAVDLRATSPNYEADSLDREVVRDILLFTLKEGVEGRALLGGADNG